MYCKSLDDIPAVRISGDGANDVLKRVLISPEQGWQGWVMRLFTLGVNGRSPRHAHSWPHIVFVHSGVGTIYVDGEDHEVAAGYAAVVPGNVEHQFANRGQGDFCFVCIVPEAGDA